LHLNGTTRINFVLCGLLNVYIIIYVINLRITSTVYYSI
jgi:hypothetical protein